MKLREASAADRDAILDLRRRCFGDDDREKADPRFWEWEFRDGRMFVAEDDGIVAHIAFIPRTLVIDGEEMRAGLAVDAMTDPAYRRRGVFTELVGFARAAVDYRFLTAYQIRKAVLPGMTRNGFEPAAIAPVLVRPLSLFGVAHALQPAPSEDTLESLPNRWERWRYFENPLWRYEVTGDEDAYLVTRRTTLKGWDTLAIVDVHGDAAPLLRDALRRGRAAGIRLAAALITRHHPALPLLLRHGFLPGPHRFRFLVNSDEPRIINHRWALMWGDTDHL